MDLISSRYRKPKGRPKKSRKIKSENAKKRWAAVEESKKVNAIPSISAENCENDYVLMNKTMWSTLLINVPCSQCKACKLNVVQTKTFGLSSKLELSCENCGESFGSTFTSEREKTNKAFKINNQFVDAFLAIGRGHSSLETFSMMLGTPSMDVKTFTKCMKNISDKNESIKQKMFKLTHDVIRAAYISENPDLKDAKVIDISVSYDGTWQKRGHTSNLGVGCIIDIHTGLVVDVEVLSKYCQECVVTSNNLGENSVEFQIWYDGHKLVCEKNFTGASGTMELFAASKIWSRSVSQYGFRYVKMLSDGDSKTFHYLNQKQIYGPDIIVEKEECINHISKRLGTALRKKVQEWKTKKITLGGKKAGSLKETTILKLQNYYRKAIKDNAPEIPKMKTAIFATLFHCMSTDVKPQHTKCPEGKNSWCFFQRAIAEGQTPKSHKHMKTTLSELVVEKILPVYQRLASDEILARCISATTQNANESLHSCIWRKCPKEVYVSKKRLELAVTAAIKEHNLGYVGSLSLSEECSPEGGSRSMIASKKDERRLSQQKRKSSVSYKENQKKVKHKKKINAKSESKEITYSAGAF